MKNESGIKPLGDKVLVKVPELDEKSPGGIIIPDQSRDKQEQAATQATVVEVGGAAFPEFNGQQPIQPGDVVCIARYAGQLYTGDDGSEYRIINEDDIAGVKI